MQTNTAKQPLKFQMQKPKQLCKEQHRNLDLSENLNTLPYGWRQILEHTRMLPCQIL